MKDIVVHNLKGSFARNGLSLRFGKAKEAYSKQKIGLIYFSGRIPFRRNDCLINKNCELDAAKEFRMTTSLFKTLNLVG